MKAPPIPGVSAMMRCHSLLGWLAAGMTYAQIVADYPELTEDHIRACLAYAADRERRVVTAAKRSFCSTRISASSFAVPRPI